MLEDSGLSKLCSLVLDDTIWVSISVTGAVLAGLGD